MLDETKKTNRKKNKLMLIGLFVVFLSPFLISVYLSSISDGFEDFKNKGFLITPPRPLSELEVHDVVNEEQKPLHGKWTLTFLQQGDCLEVCKENLYRIRQIRLAMSKHDHRVQRLMILKDKEKNTYKPILAEEYRGQLLLSEQEVSESFINAFKLNEQEDPYAKSRIYIVDPLGNVMMSYEKDDDPIDIIKDLKILIKASRIG